METKKGKRYLGIEFAEKVKVPLEVGRQNRLDDEEAESFELAVVEVDEPRVPTVGEQQAPRGGRVVVLQHGPVVVEYRLRTLLTDLQHSPRSDVGGDDAERISL